MRLAQQLYEGVDIGEGSVGLITYMRTDSVSLAAEAVREIRAVTARLYGPHEVAEEPRVYKTKSKNAQEAHEAIRPTSAAITPADIEGKIDDDLYRLYALIWKRAVASQMSHALFDTVAVDMLAGAGRPAAPPAARQRLDAGEAGLHRRVPGRQRRRRRRRHRSRAAADEGGRRRAASRAHRHSSTSPSRRRATPRPRWSRRSRSTASAGPRPTPPSSRRCRIANTSRWTAGASCRPTSARSSTAS